MVNKHFVKLFFMSIVVVSFSTTVDFGAAQGREEQGEGNYKKFFPYPDRKAVDEAPAADIKAQWRACAAESHGGLPSCPMNISQKRNCIKGILFPQLEN